jgi:hypothetical protein
MLDNPGSGGAKILEDILRGFGSSGVIHLIDKLNTMPIEPTIL